MNIVKSGRARTKIKQYLLKVDRDQNKDSGLDLFEKACRVFGTSLKSLKKTGDLDKLVETFSAANFDDLLIQIGAGKLEVKSVLTEVPSIKRQTKEDEDDSKKKLEELNSFSNDLSKKVIKKSQSDNAVIVDGQML